MADTPRLDLPYLAASQAQKEVYHNISLDRLDLLVQCSVLDRNLSTPPGAPAAGAAYIVGPAPTGTWAGHADHLALYVNAQWEFIAPLPGFQCWVIDETVQVYWSGTAWVIVSAGGGGATTFLGLLDTPDSYSGQAGKAVLVNAGGTALEFGTTGGGAPPDATYITATSNGMLSAERVLTDNTQVTWDLSTAGEVRAGIASHGVALGKLETMIPGNLLGRADPGIGDVQLIAIGTGLAFVGTTLTAPGGVTDFLGLTDTPDSYTGQGGKVVAVNPGATALEFVTGGGASYTDEQAQDAVGTILTDSATLDFTYDDATPSITGIVKDASLTEAKLVLADVTTLNVSTTQHGFVPKAPNVATQFLNGTGAWSTPAGGGSYTNEDAQDAVGTILTNTPAIVFTYNDATPSISAALGFGGIATDRIADDAVTFAKMQNMTDQRLLGRSTGSGPGNISELTVGTGLTLSGGVLSASGGGAPTDAQYLVAAAHASLTSEVVVTSAGLALLDDADDTAQRTTLGLGTMATQNANAVAITDGAISLGGHAPTGVLDVQSSVVASDIANRHFGLRVWPVAPSGSGGVQGIRVEPMTGAASGTAYIRGVSVQEQPVTTGGVTAFESALSAGTGRYAFHGAGTAPSYFGGTVQVAGTLGIASGPDPVVGLTMGFPKDTGYGIRIRQTVNDTGVGQPILFVNVASSVIGSVTSSGSGVAYNTSSDVRLKHAIAPLTAALDRVRALRPVAFKWNADDSPGVGFLAHELQQTIPEAVTGQPDEMNDDGSIRPQGVDHSKLVPWLTSAVQALLARVETLEAQVAALQA
jgi:hypothetical protein